MNSLQRRAAPCVGQVEPFQGAVDVVALSFFPACFCRRRGACRGRYGLRSRFSQWGGEQQTPVNRHRRRVFIGHRRQFVVGNRRWLIVGLGRRQPSAGRMSWLGHVVLHLFEGELLHPRRLLLDQQLELLQWLRAQLLFVLVAVVVQLARRLLLGLKHYRTSTQVSPLAGVQFCPMRQPPAPLKSTQ